MREVIRNRKAFVLALAVALASAADRTDAQKNDTRLLMGVTLNRLRTDHPEGGELAAGALLGVERHVMPNVSLRAVATATRAIIVADDIALCHPIPGGCLPDAVFPRWLAGFSLDASATPNPSWPIRLLAGLGGHFTGDPAERGGPSTSEPGSKITAHWRLGVDVLLGSSPKAGSVQLSRTYFARSQYSVSGVDALTLSVRR
jgi:hypothetical protein